MRNFIITFSAWALCFSVMSCAQNKNAENAQKNSKNKNLSTPKRQDKIMDLSKITNQTVNAAMEAWQNGDSKTFLSYFTANPSMTDDGNPRNFQSFVKDACGKEKYLTIDKVENDGKDVFGNFKAGNWGTFKVFFKFHQNNEGKFERLDIGQAKY